LIEPWTLFAKYVSPFFIDRALPSASLSALEAFTDRPSLQLVVILLSSFLPSPRLDGNEQRRAKPCPPPVGDHLSEEAARCFSTSSLQDRSTQGIRVQVSIPRPGAQRSRGLFELTSAVLWRLRCRTVPLVAAAKRLVDGEKNARSSRHLPPLLAPFLPPRFLQWLLECPPLPCTLRCRCHRRRLPRFSPVLLPDGGAKRQEEGTKKVLFILPSVFFSMPSLPYDVDPISSTSRGSAFLRSLLADPFCGF
jgi:hypothetical protein